MSSVSLSKIVALSLVTTLFVPLLIHGSASADTSGGQYGGSIRVAVVGPVNVNPAATGPTNQTLHELIYDSLARKASDTLLPQPWLASSWSINEPAKSITFRINPNAKWSDGVNLTAADVVRNFLSDYTVNESPPGNVTFTFASGGGRFLDEGIYRPIVQRSASGTAFSGPFKVNETASDHLTIAYNPFHWNGRPFLDSIRYDFYSNMSLAACALITGAATFIGFPLTGGDYTTVYYPCNQPIGFDNKALFYSTEVPGLLVTYLGMNTNQAPLNDPILRLAISKTVDRDLFPTVSAGLSYTNIADSFISPFNTYWFNTTMPKYRVPRSIVGNTVTPIFDTINMQLEAAGYMDWNYDGWRESPSRQPFGLTLLRLSSETPALVDTLESDLRSVGIKIDDRTVDTPAQIQSQVLANNFTLYVGTLLANQTPSFLRNYFASSEITRGLNYFNYNDPVLDAIFLNMDNSLNMTMRQKYVRDAQTRIATQAPAATIVSTRALTVYTKLQYEGWVNQPGGINNFWSFYNLHAIPAGSMTVDVSALTSGNRLEAGKSTDIQVAVGNDTGGVISGATVTITVSSGTIANPTGITDSTGRYTTRYTAAAVTFVTNVLINANVTKAGHPDAIGQTAIAVHPAPGVLSVDVSFPQNKRTLASGEEIDITVTVLSSTTTLPLQGAAVTVTVIPEGIGAELIPASGVTNATGGFMFKFKATVDVTTNFALQITVTNAGYSDASMSPGVIVQARGGAPSTPGPDVIIIVAVVTMLAFIYGVRRSRRWEDSREKK